MYWVNLYFQFIFWLFAGSVGLCLLAGLFRKKL